jgi:Papain-like cysteine protease AvrRpt2
MTNRFEIQTQKKPNWCWAAVAATVSEYFFDENPLSQCEIATRVLEQPGLDCCAAGNSAACNQQAALEAALGRVKEASGGGMINRKLDNQTASFDCICRQIDAGLPVCVRIQWIGDDGGHFVMISGYSVSDDHTRWVDVSDPYYEDSTVPYDQFLSAYLEAGEWSDTYLVNQPAGDDLCRS